MDILGVRVDDVTYEEALARAGALAGSAMPRYVVTPNPEFVVLSASPTRPGHRPLSAAGTGIYCATSYEFTLALVLCQPSSVGSRAA